MEDTQTMNVLPRGEAQVWGVETLITAKVREEIKPENFEKVVKLMWRAIERTEIHSKTAPEDDLTIVLLAGERVATKDYLSGKRELTTIVKEDSQ